METGSSPGRGSTTTPPATPGIPPGTSPPTGASTDRVLAARSGDQIIGVAVVGTDTPCATFVGGAVARQDRRAVEIAIALLAGAAELTADRRLDIELDDWMEEVARAIEPWPSEVVDEAYIVAEHSGRA